MKKIYSLLILLSFGFIGHCQNISVRYEVGIGQYQLDDLKSFQTYLKDMVGALDVKSVETFPNALYYGFGADYKFSKNSSVGVLVYYNTTAGRNHLKDYSGEYKMDILLNSIALGTNYSFLLFRFANLNINGSLTGGVRLSTLELNEKITVYNESLTNSNYDFNSVNCFFVPSGELNYPIGHDLSLKLKAGYEFDLSSRYYYKENSKQILKDNDNEDLNIDYSGLRIGLGVSYSF